MHNKAYLMTLYYKMHKVKRQERKNTFILNVQEKTMSR